MYTKFLGPPCQSQGPCCCSVLATGLISGIIEPEVQAEEIESQVIIVNGNVQAGKVMMQVYESEKSNTRK